jgi:hypothetical protein
MTGSLNGYGNNRPVVSGCTAEASQRDGIMLAPGMVRPHLERSPWMRFNVAVCEDTRVQPWLQQQAPNKAT